MRVPLIPPLTLAELAAGLRAAPPAVGGERLCRGIATDSREVRAGDVFLALQGAHTDGNRYVSDAQNRRAAAVITNLPEFIHEIQMPRLLVDDPVKALGRLAVAQTWGKSHRVVAITGSVGKTTTKAYTASVLAQGFAVHQTEGNYNNHLGLPLTLLATPPEAEVLVLEMGMNHAGEISYLSQLAQPHIGVITHIGTAHIGLLGSREAICRAKLELLDGMTEDGVLLLGANEELLAPGAGLLRAWRGRLPQIFYVGWDDPQADFAMLPCPSSAEGQRYLFRTPFGPPSPLSFQGVGMPAKQAALFAAAVGCLLGIPTQGIETGLRTATLPAMRQRVYEIGDLTVLDDCYNASPESVRAACDTLRELAEEREAPPHEGKPPFGRTVALLGDMLELGDFAEALHRQTGAYAAHNGLGLLFVFGRHAAWLAEGALEGGMEKGRVVVLDDRHTFEENAARLLSLLQPHDLLLVKASRAAGAERFLAYLRAHWKD
ncbi:MAG: UDP-N-acetylmuramoyl-tripeptide--D-alanyl-D-alanine ligase [Eubacteriales bacterium]